MSAWLKKNSKFWYVFDGFSLIFSFFAQSELLPLLLAQLLLFKERREQFTLVTHDKRAIVKKSLPLLFYTNSLMKLMAKEGRERFSLFHKQIALSVTKNERFARKLMSEFPTLPYLNTLCILHIVLVVHTRTCWYIQFKLFTFRNCLPNLYS